MNSEQLLSDNLHMIRPRECVYDALYLVGELKAHYLVPAEWVDSCITNSYKKPFVYNGLLKFFASDYRA